MPPPSPLWAYFHHDKSHYKNDRTHLNAWCKACILSQKRVLLELDASRTRGGEITAVRSPLELEQAGMLDIQFFSLDRPKNNTAIARVTPICGKSDRMKTHVKNCKSLTDDERTLAMLTVPPAPTRRQATALREHPTLVLSSPATSFHHPTAEPSLPSNTATRALDRSAVRPSAAPLCVPALKRSKSLHDGRGGVRTLAKVLSPQELQDDFAGDLCKLLISLNTAWAAADNPTLHTFVHKWIGPEVVVQDRRIVSGRVLDNEVRKVENKVRQKVRGKLATGSCDGWKNIAKTSVVTSLMTVDTIVSQYSLLLEIVLTSF